MDPLPTWPHRDDLTDVPDEVLRQGIEHADALLHLAGEFHPGMPGDLAQRCVEVRREMTRLRADCVRELERRRARTTKQENR